MTCKNPYTKGGLAFGCGSCSPCRVKYAREWQARILLEREHHDTSVFVTLTYDGDNLPDDYNLKPAHTRDFLKRLREAIKPAKIRYFLCGEYGTKNIRPHYHAILFGYPTCKKGNSFFVNGSCCPSCDLLLAKWGFGLIAVGTLTAQSARYVSGYVTKADSRDYEGMYPPFTRVSRKPGLGYDSLHDIASKLLEYDLEKSLPDVPQAINLEGQPLPLNKYMRKHLRRMVGKDEKCPPEILEKLREELHPLREAAYASAPPGSKEFAFKQAIIDRDQGRIIHSDYRRNQKLRKRKL